MPYRGMTLQQIDSARARFEAVVNAGTDTLHTACVVSSADVPDLIREIQRLRSRHQILEAACRAGLLAAVESEPRPASSWVLDSPWLYVTDALAQPPHFHPLSDALPSRFWGGDEL